MAQQTRKILPSLTQASGKPVTLVFDCKASPKQSPVLASVVGKRVKRFVIARLAKPFNRYDLRLSRLFANIRLYGTYL